MQKKYRLDKETMIKICKGAGWALSSPVVLQIASMIVKTDIPLWSKLLIWGVPTGINAIREFIKGDDTRDTYSHIAEAGSHAE